MRQSAGHYAALALVLAAALVYQVRYTAYYFPAWFGKTVVQYPFFIFRDQSEPGFTLYLLPHTPSPGLQNGERVLAVDGKPLTGSAVFGEALAKHRPGELLRATVIPRTPSGPMAARTVAVRLTRAGGQVTVIGLLLFIILPAFCFVLGLWVSFIRPRDPRAWLVLALMLGFAGFFNPGAESWGPWLREYGAGYHTFAGGCLPIWLLLFGIYFPEPFAPGTRWARWTQLKWFIIIPLALETAAEVTVSVGSLDSYASVFWLQRIVAPFGGFLNFVDAAALLAMFLCLAVKLRLAVSPDTKRRVRLLFAGTVVSLAPILSLIIAGQILGVSAEQYFPRWLILLSYLLFFLFPLTLAYVVVVHRAMDVRVVIRQGVQYALARGSVRVLRLAISIVLGAAIFASIAHVGKNSPASYAIIGIGVAIWLGLRRVLESLRAWIDRRFFRDAYNAEQLLSELGDNVRSIIETQPLLATVASRISESLHVPRVAVLTDGSGPYQPAFALGFDPAPTARFPENAATVERLREAKEPVRVYFDDPNSWVFRTPRMTDEERSRLAELKPELLLPLSVKEKLLGFISLGQKRSEEPYSPTDLRLLESVAAQTGLALEVSRLTQAIGEQIAQRETLNRELEIAREVQQRLFPQTLPPIPGLDYCGACRPALGVGGDYYDFLALPDGKLGIALGDVSGKGVAAALMMASLQASLRAEASRGDDDLGAMLQRVNHLVYDTTAENRYATFFYAQYNPADRHLTYVNAGHNPPFLFQASGRARAPLRLDIGGTVIGLFEDFPFQQGTVVLEKGDLLVAFTDGITETMNSMDEEWSEANLIQAIESSKDLTAREMIIQIMHAADTFAAGNKQHDDMTLVISRLIAWPV